MIGCPLLLRAGRTQERQLLHARARRRQVEVTARIGGDVVAGAEDALGAEGAKDLERRAVDDDDPSSPPTYRNCCSGSADSARLRAKGASGVMTCPTNAPSSVNACTRRFSRSAAYTMPSFDTRMACRTLNLAGPGSEKPEGACT